MIGRVDNRPATAPTKPTPKSVGEAVGEAAAKVLGDDLKLSSKKPTAEDVDKAFDRLEKAEAKARALSVGTLGGFPAYEKALDEVKAAKDDLAKLRKEAPELVAAEEKERAAEPGLFDFVKKWALFAVAPVPALLFKLFGKKDD